MTTTQLALIVGVIYIAPHIPKPVALAFGLIFLGCAAVIRLTGGEA